MPKTAKHFVYIMRGGGWLKPGISRDVESRLRHFNGGHVPFEMELILFMECRDIAQAKNIEFELFGMLPKRARGEWFVDLGWTAHHLAEITGKAARKTGDYRREVIYVDAHEIFVHRKKADHEKSKFAAGKRAAEIMERISRGMPADKKQTNDETGSEIVAYKQ